MGLVIILPGSLSVAAQLYSWLQEEIIPIFKAENFHAEFETEIKLNEEAWKYLPKISASIGQMLSRRIFHNNFRFPSTSNRNHIFR